MGSGVSVGEGKASAGGTVAVSTTATAPAGAEGASRVLGSMPGTAAVLAAEAQPATAKTNKPKAVQRRDPFKPVYPRPAGLVPYPEIRAHRDGGFAPGDRTRWEGVAALLGVD